MISLRASGLLFDNQAHIVRQVFFQRFAVARDAGIFTFFTQLKNRKFAGLAHRPLTLTQPR